MEKPLQWHPAFQAVLQIEFAEEAADRVRGGGGASAVFKGIQPDRQPSAH